MVTINDVAKKAGVSISSVSYTLNGGRPISEAKKALIFQVIRELGYHPNASARSLASKKTNNIALLFPRLRERTMGLSEMQFLISGGRYTLENSYSMVLWFLDAWETEKLRSLIRQKRADGVILMEVRRDDPFVRILTEEGIPFFLIGHDDTYSGNNYVDIDFDRSMEMMIAKLVSGGHRYIGFINHPQETFTAGYAPAVKCHQAFRTYCDTMGVSGYAVFCNSNPQCGYNAVLKLLHEHSEISVIISLNQSCMSGIIKAAADMGKTIPENMSIIVFASAPFFGTNFLPSISAWELDIPLIMEEAVLRLIKLINNRDNNIKEKLILCQLMERQSYCSDSLRPPVHGAGQ
jgi:DNA-binding LacI/PurR family transcriptional regulator